MTSPSTIPGECGRFHEDLGMWIRAAPRLSTEPRAALILDRDGVIVEDPGYLGSAADLVMIAGSAEIIASANRLGVPVVEVTNQAGIARGYYGWEEFIEVEDCIARELARGSARIDASLACPFHRDGLAPWAHAAHPARKPRPGMLLAAARLLNLDLSKSWVVGDKIGDLQAGANAGLRGGFHVLTGHGREHRPAVLDFHPYGFELRFGDSILDAGPLLDLITISK